MRLTDERYRRDLRRLTLARRLVRFEVRTSLVAEWTGLTESRVRALYRHELAQGVAEATHRRRGPAPHQLMRLCGSPTARSESGAAAAACQLHGVFPPERGEAAAKRVATVERGERLCAAYESYRAQVPAASLTLDQVMLLVRGIVAGTEIVTMTCAACDSLLVVECGLPRAPQCAVCRTPAPTRRARRARAASIAPNAEPSLQQSLF